MDQVVKTNVTLEELGSISFTYFGPYSGMERIVEQAIQSPSTYQGQVIKLVSWREGNSSEQSRRT